MGEEDERKHEEKQRARGPEGQRPLIPNKVCVQLVKHQEGRKKRKDTLHVAPYTNSVFFL